MKFSRIIPHSKNEPRISAILFSVGFNSFANNTGTHPIWQSDRMVDDETMISSVCGSLALEGMPVPESTRKLMRDCISGRITYDDAVKSIIARYSGETDA